MPDSSNEWKNRKRIHYAVDDAAGPVDLNKKKEADQCLSDWNRWANSGDKCPVYIKGIQLSKYPLLPTFDNQATLLNFLKSNLFSQETSDDVINAAMSHFHQGGIFNATQMSINNIAGAATRLNQNAPRPGEAEQRIDLDCDDRNNITITEKNIYKKYTEGAINHLCINKPYDYYAKTETTYLFTPDKNIELVSFEVDCPKKKLANLFREPAAKQNILNRVVDYMQHLIKDKTRPTGSLPTEPTRIYTHR